MRQIVGQYRGTRSGPLKLEMYVYYVAAGGVSQPEKRGMRHGDGGRFSRLTGSKILSPNSSGLVRQLKEPSHGMIARFFQK
jgi:hypothetical protein